MRAELGLHAPPRVVDAVLVAAVIGAAPAGVAALGGPCREGGNVRIWRSPAEPAPAHPLRALAVSHDTPLDDVIVLDAVGHAVAVTPRRLGGPPWSIAVDVATPTAGVLRVEVRHEGASVACREIEVAATRRRAARAGRGVWPSRLDWDRDTEALYAAWIEHLFDAPPDEDVSFPSLEPVLRDPGRNLLHDHLGLGEDGPGPAALPATPDCADLPYFLRAYFAWKLGLPFGFRECSRGTAQAPPRCGRLVTNEDPAGAADTLSAFRAFLRRLVDTVHSGSARTLLDDDVTDLYPLPLDRAALVPGSIYADPYGHTLVVVKWVPQTPEGGGRLLAVDAQPDDSIGRKRFWQGTFLFDGEAPSVGPGFKAFRPVVADGAGGLRALPNAALRDDTRFAPYSLAQAALSSDAFHARMAALVNPQGLDPVRAYDETLAALVEQLEARVRAVENGEQHVRETHGAVIPMPEEAAIFETTGPWEDYATPARDFRLLIAMTVLEDLPRSVVQHPDLFVLGGQRPEDARTAVESLHQARMAERSISYTRSDGTPWRITVADVLRRRAALEVGYNPNDCPEVRWGAEEGTEEHATCRRRAPTEQRARMEHYRAWFREGRRPSR